MNEARVALVTGAAGAVGPDLVRALLGSGYAVRALVRTARPDAKWPSDVEVIVGDIRDAALVRQAASSASTVFHLAAKLHVPNPPRELRGEYESANVEGTRVVLAAADEAGVERVVFFSTVSVYGATGPEPVTEDSAPRPDTLYAETKLRAEKLVLESGRGVVLRMAAVYGPRMKGNYISLVNGLKRGRFIPIGPGTNLRTLVFVEDAARAAILAAEHPAALGRVYNVTDGSVHSVAEITEAICEALGKRLPRFVAPVGVARVAAGIGDLALAAAGRRPRLSSAFEKYLETVAVSARRIQAELGFRPEYDLRRGWAEAVCRGTDAGAQGA